MNWNIRRFTESDLDAAGEIAFRLWGEELPAVSEADSRLIYRYLARYYFHPGSRYSFCVEEEGGMTALLLAHRLGDETGGPAEADAWLAPRIAPEKRKLFAGYRAYLEGNLALETRAAREGELILALFASIRPGRGRTLLETLRQACRKTAVPSMILWSDDTCDFEYYDRHGFEEIGRYPTVPSLDGRAMTTYLFRKRF